MSWNIGKWIRGWHLERLFQHAPNGDISVKDAAKKVVDIIDQIFIYWLQYEPIFDAIAPDDGEQSVAEIKAKLTEIQGILNVIETLPDISDNLKDFRFATDDKTNDFIHNLVSTAALAFNDGKISIFEAAGFAGQIALFIKEK